jgi:hypothetical protein
VNCVRTLPWVRGVHEKYASQGLQVIGIHSPEFGYEKSRGSLAAEITRHGLAYPNLLDNDMAYWNALGNQYWPTTYLVDKCGRIRERHAGEVHAGEPSGHELERAIEALLAEAPEACSRP